MIPQSLIQGANGPRFTMKPSCSCIPGSVNVKFGGECVQKLSENESKNVDEDEDTDEDEGDGISPDSGILDIGIPELGCSKLWIYKEYIQLYKFSMTIWNLILTRSLSQWLLQDSLALVSTSLCDLPVIEIC